MSTISVSVPEELKRKISQVDEVNWSAIARKAFEKKKLEELELFKKLVKKKAS